MRLHTYTCMWNALGRMEQLASLFIFIQCSTHGNSRAVPCMFTSTFLLPFREKKKKIQLCHVLINFQPEKAKKYHHSAVVWKVKAVLQGSPWVRNSLGSCSQRSHSQGTALAWGQWDRN